MKNTFYYNLNSRNMLRKVIVKIELESIDTQKRVTSIVGQENNSVGYKFRVC